MVSQTDYYIEKIRPQHDSLPAKNDNKGNFLTPAKRTLNPIPNRDIRQTSPTFFTAKFRQNVIPGIQYEACR